jgi:hypothetical protein
LKKNVPMSRDAADHQSSQSCFDFQAPRLHLPVRRSWMKEAVVKKAALVQSSPTSPR